MLNRKARITLDLLRPSTVSEPIRNTKMEESFNSQHGAVHRSYQAEDPVYVMKYSKSGRSWVPGIIIVQRAH